MITLGRCVALTVAIAATGIPIATMPITAASRATITTITIIAGSAAGLLGLTL